MSRAAWRAATLALGLAAAAAAAQAEQRRSGFDFMGPATQALQRDDAQNPAMLWVKDGEQRFAARCGSCHTPDAMRGVAARYPAFDALLARPVTLAARIKQCHERPVQRQTQMQAQTPGQAPAPAPLVGDALLALESYVAFLSRGLPLAPPADPRLAPFRAQGERLYRQRMGQFDLSCAQCHDGQAGRRLGGSLIPQAHPTAYPIYRLEWQGMGGLQRRLRGCMAGVRAEPFADGSDEFTALELFLVQRAAGMAMEAPGVRP